MRPSGCIFAEGRCTRRVVINLTYGPVPIGPACVVHADEFGVGLALEEIKAGGDGIDGYRRWRKNLGLAPADLSTRMAELGL